MADKSNDTKTDDAPASDMPKKLPAVTGTESEQNKTILDAADDAEVAAPDTDIEDDGLDELPEGAVLAGGTNSTDQVIADATGNGVIKPKPIAPFADEHVGVGGTFVVGEDGVRRPAYESYQVPAPGKKGEKGEMVTKYRRVV